MNYLLNKHNCQSEIGWNRERWCTQSANRGTERTTGSTVRDRVAQREMWKYGEKWEGIIRQGM